MHYVHIWSSKRLNTNIEEKLKVILPGILPVNQKEENKHIDKGLKKQIKFKILSLNIYFFSPRS